MWDLNCDLENPILDYHTGKLLSFSSLYELTQVISEPTRITKSTSTLTDFILTNTLEHILSSGVISSGISDHNLAYAVRNFKLPKFEPILREVRDFKQFSETQFRNYLLKLPWDIIFWYEDPNQCWSVWKSSSYEILKIRTPIRHERVRSNPIPWITPVIKQLIRVRDYDKKKAVKWNSTIH